MAQLTSTQKAALETVRAAGTLYAYNGVSASTIAVLEREGFVSVTWGFSCQTTYRTHRTHPVRDWSAVIKES